MTHYTLKDFEYSAESRVLLEKILGLPFSFDDTEDTPEYFEAKKRAENFDIDKMTKNESTQELINEMAQRVMIGGPEIFIHFYEDNSQKIVAQGNLDPAVWPVLKACFTKGISEKHGSCANDLGALYYMGELVEQNYDAAAFLYDLAASWGCYQSIINLGYIYEYGRIGTPDYVRALSYYSLAAALSPSAEALYKLGDVFARGKIVPKDMAKAVSLWHKAYDAACEADNIRDEGQVCIRLAPLFLDSNAKDYGLSIDPIQALHFYQIAEIGLRRAINEGEVYFQKRLEEALAGQAAARNYIELTTLDGLDDLGNLDDLG